MAGQPLMYFAETEIINKKNKNNNIHKSEDLKYEDKQTLTLEECQN